MASEAEGLRLKIPIMKIFFMSRKWLPKRKGYDEIGRAQNKITKTSKMASEAEGLRRERFALLIGTVRSKMASEAEGLRLVLSDDGRVVVRRKWLPKRKGYDKSPEDNTENQKKLSKMASEAEGLRHDKNET